MLLGSGSLCGICISFFQCSQASSPSVLSLGRDGSWFLRLCPERTAIRRSVQTSTRDGRPGPIGVSPAHSIPNIYLPLRADIYSPIPYCVVSLYKCIIAVE
ncbi:hypothetical protein HOY80DRAFT_970976 [Tuber brumale]|nr:hypothetical protein HOY80DRAFT_970976 [Tuber brumale]